MAGFQKATRQRAKLRLALAGLGGGGKTFTSLLVASILAELMREQLGRRGRIGVIDTEHESASLYAMTDAQLTTYSALEGQSAIDFVAKANSFDFDTLPLDNHSPYAYIEALHEAQRCGYDIAIVDSLSHAWAGKNGALEQKDNAAARGGNSWTAWREVTPMHNKLVDAMLSCPMHLIATLRQKMEYVQNNGKVEQVGLAAIQREGMEYEFTIFADMEKATNGMRIGKHRLPGVLSIGDVFEKPGEAFARKIFGWLMSGAAPLPRPVDAAPAAASTADDLIMDTFRAIDAAGSLAELDGFVPVLRTFTGAALGEGRKRYGASKDRLTAQLVAASKAAPAPAASSEPTRSADSSGASADDTEAA